LGEQALRTRIFMVRPEYAGNQAPWIDPMGFCRYWPLLC